MIRARFRPHQRLLHKAEFDRVFRAGRRGTAHGLTVILRESEGSGSRLGVSVSRKFGHAVARNRARRLLREAFRQTVASLPTGFDIVAMPRIGHFPDGLAEVIRALRQSVEGAVRSKTRSMPRKARAP